jgi:hypothetical protein
MDGSSAVPASMSETRPTPTDRLVQELQDDRRWLLRQLDAGHWPELRLDLASLERELGHLLERAHERLSGG